MRVKYILHWLQNVASLKSFFLVVPVHISNWGVMQNSSRLCISANHMGVPLSVFVLFNKKQTKV